MTPEIYGEEQFKLVQLILDTYPHCETMKTKWKWLCMSLNLPTIVRH